MQNNKIKILIILFFIVLCIYSSNRLYSKPAPPVNNNFKQLTTEDGLSQNSVTSILQDQYGFMWFGTYNGLNRYDGYDFQHFPVEKGNPKALSSKSIWALTEDKEGYIWIGTKGGGVCKYNPIKDTFTQYLNDPEDSTSIGGSIVKIIYEDKEGTLWFGRENGISKYNRQEDNFTQYKLYQEGFETKAINQITAIYEDSNHILWIATNGGLFFENRRDSVFKPKPFDFGDFSVDNIYSGYDFFEDKNSNLWLTTYGDGVFKFDSSRTNLVRYHTDAPSKRKISNNTVLSIEQDSRGRIWMGTWSGGVNIYHPKSEKINTIQEDISNPNSLAVNSVISIYKSKNNIFWLGTTGGGVNKYDINKEQFKTLSQKRNESNSLINNSVNCIKEYKDKILIGTNKGLDLYNPTQDNHTHFQIPEKENSANEIRSIAPDTNNIIWLGTNGSGLIKYNLKTQEYEIYDVEKGLSHNYIYSITMGEGNIIWIATQNGGLNRFNKKTETFTYFIKESYSQNNLNTDRLSTLYKDTTNILWIGTQVDGLYYYNTKEDNFINVNEYASDTFSSSNLITTIIKDHQGNIWAGTNNGLLKYNPDDNNLNKYLVDAELPSNVIQGIIEDSTGHLWLSTDRGLIRFNPTNQNYVHFSESDGLVSNQFHANSSLQSKGTFYFGTSIKGAVYFKPQNIQRDTSLPQINITDLRISNKSVPIGENFDGRTILDRTIFQTDKIQLSYKDNIISFEFVALHFSTPQENQYAYKLENFEDEWNYSGNRRYATYTNLSPGNYTFHVRGANSDGIWNNEGAKLEIEIPPPFWKTTWFYIFLVISIIGGVILIIHFRTQKIRERHDFLAEMNRKLNSQIAQKDEAIKEKNQAKKKLEKVKNYIDNIINSMPSILISVNSDGVITRWNKQAEEEAGVSSKEAVGKKLEKVFPRFVDEMDKIQTAISEHEIQKSTDKRREIEGETKFEDITIYPLETDQTEGAVIRIDDKTERKRLEEMMIQSEKMLSVGGLAAGMAHEINNPLAGMIQNASVVINRLTNTDLSANKKAADKYDINIEKIKKFMQERNIIEQLELINDSGKRASKIVRNMLSFARKNESKYTTVDITEVLEDTVNLAQNDYDLKKKYDFRQIKIQREFAPDLPKIQCERSKIQQVFLNLLKNGAEAMHKEKNRTEDPKFILRANYLDKEDKIQVEIEDNGPGIPDDVRKRVFEPFFTTKDVDQGTGLGLSVSYFIITENHNGEMLVESSPGKFTKFIILLPLTVQE